MLSKVFAKHYNEKEWLCIKISIMFLWVLFVLFIVKDYSGQPYAIGICKLFDCSIISTTVGRVVFVIANLVLAYCYIRDKYMVATTFLLGVSCLVYFSLQESNGIHNRCSLFTFIFFAQSIAYSLHKLGYLQNILKYRIQFSVQAVAASYTLAALSKLTTSGFGWIADTPNMALQIVKSFSYRYIDYNDISIFNEGMTYAEWILDHSILVQLLLGFSLFLELFAVLALVNRRTALVYGLLLLGMHIGIAVLMDIWMMLIAYPMIVYLINPLYLFSTINIKALPVLSRVKQRILAVWR
ncbi:hypothetical protein BH09BAC1_BH09BAC1_20050 [soil metagenome]